MEGWKGEVHGEMQGTEQTSGLGGIKECSGENDSKERTQHRREKWNIPKMILIKNSSGKYEKIEELYREGGKCTKRNEGNERLYQEQ